MKLGDLVVGIGANTKKLDEELGKAQRKLKYFGKNTKALGKSLSIGLTAPLAIMGATSVRAFQVQAKAIAQVEAGLKSTGSQAGFTSKQLQAMASDLQSKTLFGDETILKDATAQLLTFTNISGEQFARTQQAALDLATRLDGDLKGASIQLGKALNDPVANLSALSRSGIQFSDEQKAVIKSMAETGRLAEAQTLILDELNRQYGGSAEAAAKADGGFTQLANSFGDLQEAIGQQLIPILRPLVDWLTQTVAKMQEAPDSFKRAAVVIGLVAGAIGPLLVVIPSLIGGVRALRGAMLLLNTAMLTNPFFLAAAAIAAVGVAMYGLYSNASDAEDEVGKLRDELDGMEADEAARHAAQRIKEQEEAVKKQLEAVKALRSAANMGDATDRRIHSQSLARQEEVLANEQKKLEGFQQEAAILEGLQQRSGVPEAHCRGARGGGDGHRGSAQGTDAGTSGADENGAGVPGHDARGHLERRTRGPGRTHRRHA
jgi:TolA-binding protein